MVHFYIYLSWAACCFCFATWCCRDSVPCAISFLLTVNAIRPSSLRDSLLWHFHEHTGVIIPGGKRWDRSHFFFPTWDTKAGSRWPSFIKMCKILISSNVAYCDKSLWGHSGTLKKSQPETWTSRLACKWIPQNTICQAIYLWSKG